MVKEITPSNIEEEFESDSYIGVQAAIEILLFGK